MTTSDGSVHRPEVPYVLDVSTRRDEAGHWVCRMEYPELPGCVAEAVDVFEALDLLEHRRARWLAERSAAGLDCPAPRAALRI